MQALLRTSIPPCASENGTENFDKPGVNSAECGALAVVSSAIEIWRFRAEGQWKSCSVAKQISSRYVVHGYWGN
jgi:hypothetical protein